MKIKLYKGPFSGKSYTTDGREELVVSGPKPMTRKQKYEHQVNAAGGFNNFGSWTPRIFPRVEARYRMVYRVHETGNGMLCNVPCMHPDGSVFFEYVPGSKQEF